VRRV
jgi:hypothetical protein